MPSSAPSSSTRRVILHLRVLALGLSLLGAALPAAPATFVLTSDLHYGLHRSYFRGEANVPATVVNAALAEAINSLPGVRLPDDGGLRAGAAVGTLDFVVVTGDIANRQELLPLRIQPAAVSWAQFEETFERRLSLRGPSGQPVPLLLVPGNHDLSNAIGGVMKLVPETDATAMAGIYNRMMAPAQPRTAASYRFPEDTVRFTRDVGGVHCVFLTIWPDSATRAWMEEDLRRVPASTPVLLFCHDQPAIEAKHLLNPNGDRGLNARDRFENLTSDRPAEGSTVDTPTTPQQRELAAFLARHRNLVAYFHGNENWNEFYAWTGPDGAIDLPVFRVDSTIKGRASGKDERQLSIQVVTYDREAGQLTAREYRWNTAGAAAGAWGEHKTIPLAPRAR